jgi:alkylation response protein AidB-like acyl-CoA dehydrogenase
MALSVPEPFGGLGCGFLEQAIVMEEFGRGLVLEPYLSTAVLCGTVMQHAECESVRAEWFGRLASGDLLAALAHEEPGRGWGAPGPLQTVLTRHAGGWRLDGAKTLVLGGPSAHRLLLTARLAEDALGRFVVVVVDPAAPGVSMTAYPLLDFTRASDLRLDAVDIPEEALLVGAARAGTAVDEALDLAVLATVSQALGTMETILALTVEHLKTRVQFGKPLGRNQALQHRVAEMFIEVEETRSILFQAITRLDRGAQVRRAAVSAAKVYACGAAQVVGEQGVQLHGGLGVTVEAEVGHHYKKLVLFERLLGDADQHLERFAGAGVALNLEDE